MSDSLPSKLRAFIIDHCGIRPDKIQEESLLFSTGLLDSFSLVDIVSFFEEQTGLKVKAREISFTNFDSVARMATFAEKRAGP